MIKIDRIIHSRRKTYALVIERDGSLTVRAPLRASHAQIERLVHEKANWIQAKQEWLQSQPAAFIPRTYNQGELFYYLGNTFPLEITSPPKPALQLEDGRFRLARSALPRAAQVFTRWYHQQARHVISERAQRRAGELRLVYRSLRISSAKTRWGSCGAKGTLNFSWRLVMAPLAVIDYVILHELVHLEIRNHSPAFWGRVSALMPDYRHQVAWLKGNGRSLSL